MKYSEHVIEEVAADIRAYEAEQASLKQWPHLWVIWPRHF